MIGPQRTPFTPRLAMLSLALTLLLLSCSEYDLVDQGDLSVVLDEDTGTPCPPEMPGCHDTADTAVPVTDTWEPVVHDCQVAVATQKDVPVLEECTGTESTGTVANAYDLVIEYQYLSSGSGVIVMPAIGNLTDDNGDGRVDEDDLPDIAFTTWSSNTLVALNGDGSGEIFIANGFAGEGGVVIADVDADGEPEVIALTTRGEIAAVNSSGSTEWTSAGFPVMAYPQPIVADLDGDGKPEVIGDVGVVNGEDGSTVATLSNPANSWRTPIAADLDQDGKQEIILGNNVYDHNGNKLWSNNGTGAGNFGAVGDGDGDGDPEVFFVSGSTLYIHESDGTLIRQVGIPGSNPGPPSIADFDGDGEIEIAIPANSQIAVFDMDGTELWRMPIQDGSGLAGCSGYDMDGDGAYEVLYADEQALRMYDGATGAVLYEDYNHSSGTVWEYPVVADVDQDGSAEICIASNGSSFAGITCFGHSGDGWPESGPTWPSHDFAVTNIDPDGSVPAVPEASWLMHNVFRARPAVDEPASADLRASLVDICVASCDEGPVKVSVQVQNQGAVDIEAGTQWAFYRNDTDVLTLITTGTVDAVPAGVAIGGFVIELMPTDFGDDGFVLAIDDDGTGLDDVGECDEENNQVAWLDRICQ
jgi:hypothetical protein